MKHLALFIAALVVISTVSVGAQYYNGICDISITSLTANNDNINFVIKNNGDDTQIKYWIYVNNRLINDNVLNIGAGEDFRIHRDYNFRDGSNVIRVDVRSNCGDFDSRTISHSVDFDDRNFCYDGYLNTYRCNGDRLQRMYQNNFCDTKWVTVQTCSYGCSYNKCNLNYYDYDPYPNSDRYRVCYSGDVWMYSYSGTRLYKYSDCDYGCSYGYCENTNVFRCDAKWTCFGDNKAYITPYCDIKSTTFCPSGCTNGQCNSEIGYQINYDSRTCGVLIGSFDYKNNLEPGKLADVQVEVVNTGNQRDSISLELFVNGVRKTSLTFSLDSGQRAIKTLYYTTISGNNKINAIARSTCGSSDSISGNVFVYTDGTDAITVCNNNNVCDAGENADNCPRDCFIVDPVVTSVQIIPTSLDTKQFKAKIIVVDIKSAIDQNFIISVDGVPDEWLTFEDVVDVEIIDGSYQDTSYIYVYPLEIGRYNIDVRVHSMDENKDFIKTIDLFVAQESVREIIEEQEDTRFNLVGNVISDNVVNPFYFFSLVFAFIILVIAVAAYRLRQ